MTVGEPTRPIPLGAPVHPVLDVTPADVSDDVVERLRSACTSVSTETAEHSRDWWPLAMTWALDGGVPGLAAVVARVSSADEVSAVLAVCDEARVPVTTSAGRSGVCGSAVPVFGGVVLDVTAMSGVVGLDEESLVLDVLPGTFGDVLEESLLPPLGVTVGHWPQSMALSTVGGWLACRSAGQYSNRYGKIEDIVVGLDVVLADGSRVTTGGWPRAAVGPDLTQLFVGSEGMLGVITGARLRAHRRPASTWSAQYGFGSFADGLDACRRVIQRGARPAVMRLYDTTESGRSFEVGDRHVLLVWDEADDDVLASTAAIVTAECGGASLDGDDLVARWFSHRNDVSALEALISKGFVVDTIEVAGSWRVLPSIYEAAVAAILSVEGTLAASAHQSHAYPDGACLYFTFAGRVDEAERDGYYRAAWDAATSAVLSRGGALSHHHGVGVNRGRFVRSALGEGGFGVLRSLKAALDPRGILNPGKFGLPSPWGPAPWT